MSESAVNDVDIPTIVHDKARKEYRLTLQNLANKNKEKEPTAVLQYEIVSPGTYELYHTEVPPEFRGKGIGKVIAKHAFDDLLNKSEETEEEKNLKDCSASEPTKLILSCSFLKGYWEKNKGTYEGFDITGI